MRGYGVNKRDLGDLVGICADYSAMRQRVAKPIKGGRGTVRTIIGPATNFPAIW